MYMQLHYKELKEQNIITGKELCVKELEKNILTHFAKLWDTPNLLFHRIHTCKNMAGEVTFFEMNLPLNFFERKKNE